MTYFPAQWNRHFKLTNDIDFSSIDDDDFTPIGFSEEHSFTGVFEGNDYSVSMMTLQSPTLNNVGLFGFIGEQAIVQNLNLENALVEGASNIGILAGVNRGTIRNCHSDGQVYGSSEATGGLVGTNEDGRVTRCSSTADIMGYVSAGGLVGCNHGLVTMSYASGLVVGDNSGGLVGHNNAGLLSNCYATASVVGDNIGGVVGFNDGAIVICCYAGGHLLGESGVGGLIAAYNQPEYNVVQGSFWNSQDTRQSFSIGGLGLTSDEMASIDTYQSYGWDIAPANLATDEVWIMPDGGGYPLLSWDQDNGSGMPPFAQGSGSQSDPYLIEDINDLLVLGATPSLMDKSFRLTCDLDFLGVNVSMIGGGGVPFVGTFDGANHTLSNLTLDANNMTMVGLFAFIGKGGSVKNLGLFNVQIEGQEYIGGIAGINQGTIDNCFVTGNLRGDRAIGGIAGWNAGTISLSISVVELEGNQDLGELAGVTEAPEINTSPIYRRRGGR